MKIRPLHDQVLIKRDEAMEKTSGGIYIPPTAQAKVNSGTVLAVGSGRITKHGNVIEPRVKTGDKVLFGKYTPANEVTINDDKLILIKESEIFGTIENE